MSTLFQQWFTTYADYPKTPQAARTCLESFQAAVGSRTVRLYGAGTVARNLCAVFRELGVRIASLHDERWETLGRDDFKVLPPEALPQLFCSGDIVIVAINNNQFTAVVDQLRQLGIPAAQVLRGETLHTNLKASLCLLACLQGKALDLTECYECTILDNRCHSLKNYLQKRTGFVDTGRGSYCMDMIGCILGTVCSLQCKHCCESVPFLPKDARYSIPAGTILRDIRKLSAACNYITLVEFIGGEPFLHKDLAAIVSETLKIPNIGMVHIFSNGTVIPDDKLCETLVHERITVYISNYQTILSKQKQDNIQQTLAKLHTWQVAYFRGKKFDWRDFSSFDLQYPEDPHLLEHKFSSCFLSHCHRLAEGKLYHCPHQYAGVKMNKFPAASLQDIHSFSDAELAAALDAFEKTRWIAACRSCAMPFDAPRALSGEQCS